MREKAVEEYLRKRVRAAGGLAYKFTSPGNAGVPDRIVMLPGGMVVFIELKAPGKKPSPLQEVQHMRIVNTGCRVYVADSKEAVDGILAELGVAPF